MEVASEESTHSSQGLPAPNCFPVGVSFLCGQCDELTLREFCGGWTADDGKPICQDCFERIEARNNELRKEMDDARLNNEVWS